MLWLKIQQYKTWNVQLKEAQIHAVLYKFKIKKCRNTRLCTL
jgi:hypothetical protein